MFYTCLVLAVYKMIGILVDSIGCPKTFSTWFGGWIAISEGLGDIRLSLVNQPFLLEHKSGWWLSNRFWISDGI